ncbi:hypothetical protein M8818_004529 [Zalaria obscura]|uniref:Uncharacterized protein n=1 Tax=Zalaria obscura TaxID=2024903 RepID=A0ACC3SBD5_9PEZI
MAHLHGQACGVARGQQCTYCSQAGHIQDQDYHAERSWIQFGRVGMALWNTTRSRGAAGPLDWAWNAV